MHSAAHSDGAAKAICNSASYPEAESGPAFSLRGKERLKYASRIVRWDSATAVGNGDAEPIDCSSLAPVNGLSDA
jgi:hypothetical protein